MLTRLPVPWLGRCRIPSDLSEITQRGDEAPPRELGLEAAAIEALWSASEDLYRTGMHPALQLCIRYRGQVVLHRAIGHAAGNEPGAAEETPKRAATTATPFCIFSASKAVTAMVIHKLVEQGRLNIDDRVTDYVPEFRGGGKGGITLRHLLCHRAGIPNLPPGALDLDLLQEPRRIFELMCAARPVTRPGRLLAYHAVSGGFVLGEVVRAVMGRDIRSVLASEILEPLGMRWMNYGVAPQDVPLVAINAVTGAPPPLPLALALKRALGTSLEHAVELSNDPRFLTGVIPSANIVTTADELSAFYQCLLNEGELGGVRVFEPRTVRRATSEQSYWELDLTLGLPIRYGLGFMLGSSYSLLGRDNPKAFGHLGLSNILGWADPEREIAVGIVNSGKPLIAVHLARLVSLVLAIGEAFPRRRRVGR